MSKSIVRLAGGLLIILVIIGGLAGCSNKLPEPDYANQVAENVLQAMSNCDYEALKQDFSPEAQAALNEADFNTSCQEIKAIIGDYIDKEFWKAQTENGYMGVHYTANFSEEPDEVIVSVYFEEIDGEMYLVAFVLDSPKLRESTESGSE
jgi:hypothetical protein